MLESIDEGTRPVLQNIRDILIVVADGEHARFIRAARDNALKTEREFDSTTSHHPSADLRSDHPGASFHSASSAHHAITPRHDPHEMAKEGFGKYVAEQIKTSADRNEFSRLIIAATSHTLNAITSGLGEALQTKLIGTLAHDLVKVPDHELQPHLREWIRPVHRAK